MEWTPKLRETGYYDVQICHPDGSAWDASVAKDAHYVIQHANGTEELRINQADKGSRWESLGTYYFQAGDQSSVKVITDIAENANNTFGDAVRFEYLGRNYEEPAEIIVDNTQAAGDIGEDGWHSSTYRSGYYGEDYLTAQTDMGEKNLVYTPDLPKTGNYAVYYYAPVGDAAEVPYEIRHQEGITLKKVNQTETISGGWNFLGIYPFQEGTAGSVTVRNDGNSANILSDALKFVSVDEVLDLHEMKWSGEWERHDENEVAWKETNQQGASVSFDYQPSYTGYHAVDIQIPEEAEIAGDRQITAVCGEEEWNTDISAGETGTHQAGVFYMEEGKTYHITLKNSGTENLAICWAKVRSTGYDLMYEEFDKNSDLTKWTFSDDSDWSVENGSLTGSAGEMHQLKNEWVNGQITATIRVESMEEDGSFGLILSGSNNTFVKLEYSKKEEKFTLFNYQTERLLGTSDVIMLEEGRDYAISVNFSYPDLIISLDHEKIMELEFSRDGEIGFFAQGAQVAISALHARATTGMEMTNGTYKVNLDEPRQTIWGLGIEVQSDSIGSGNNGLPESNTSVPHDLVQSERDRLYDDMLSGFRYLRLAGGLYYRGTDEEQKHLQERWDTQDEELAELIEKSGIEGVDFEFWSPTPYFKSSNSYITTDSKNTLKCFDSSFKGDKQAFLEDFAETVKEDLQSLQKNGIPILQFGLQNEAPHKVNSYSHCHYDAQGYYETMKVMIPTLKEAFPNLHVHADSWNGQYSDGSKKIIQDKELLDLIDAWTFHRIGYNSNDQIDNASYYNSNKGREGIDVYNNEFEYFGNASDWNCINTAQSIMNWLTFENSPTWHWLHMLKPLANSEASGYALGFWRAPGDTNSYGKYDDIEEGHWDYNYQNWNSVRGFLKHMPWDSVRYDVTEDEVRRDQRIMAFKTPEGRLVVALTNRSEDAAFSFQIDTGVDAVFRGYRYTPDSEDEIELEPLAGSQIRPTLPPLSIEFWVQEPDETMKMANGISLNETELSLSENSTVQLSATVSPEDAANKEVTWTSEDYTIATVDENGRVTGLKEGETDIIAMAVSGSGRFRARCTVKVGASQEVQKADLQKLYEQYKDKEQGSYTQVSWDAFVKAREEAAAVLASQDVTQTQVDQARERLQAAVDGLKGTMLLVTFDEENAEDLSGGENHGTIVGDPEFTEGVRGKALHLVNSQNEEDEAKQYVNFGQPSELQFGNGSFSVMFWYRADADSQAEGAVVGNKYWSTGANPGFTIGDMREGLTLNINTPGGSRKDTGRYSSATDGNWHHVAAVIEREDAKTMTLYIDGTKAETPKDISSLNGSVDAADFLLGATNKEDGTKFLAVEDAYIDELSVYNYALSGEIIENAAKEGETLLELEEMKERVSLMTAGERYQGDQIQQMLDKIEEAQAAMEKEGADAQEILNQIKEDYEKFMEGNPAVMSFHLISDPHVTGDRNGTAAENLITGLQDMKTINPNAQAFLTAGDNTQNGKQEEMEVFYEILDAYNPAAADKTLVALGNHDVRGPNSGDWQERPTDPNPYWETIYSLYMKYNEKYMPKNDGAVYYDRWIGDYHFLVLNAENSAKDTAWMTETQLAWLEEKIQEGNDSQKPVFVIVHQALNDSHRGSNSYLGFGDQDAKVKEILKENPQVVLLTGHIHNGFGVAQVMDSPYGTLVDVPAFVGSENGWTGSGTGYEVYVYDTELYLRARDFVNHRWMPEYDVSIKLPSLPALCKKAEELDEEDYTAESWMAAQKALEEALPDAKEMLNKTSGNYGIETRAKINVIQTELTEVLNLLQERDPEAEAAAKVDQMIEALGEITLDSSQNIEAARAAYEALSPRAKELVTKLEQLQEAEARLAELQKQEETEKPDKPAEPDKPSETEKPEETKDPTDAGKTAEEQKSGEDKIYTDRKNGLIYQIEKNGRRAEVIASANKKAVSVTIPSTIAIDGTRYPVTSIAKGAFRNHARLRKVKIGNAVKTIGKRAFFDCRSLTKVTIGKNVVSIGAEAFRGCTNLKKVAIPAKVTKIGAKAFYNCRKLTNITVKTTKLKAKQIGKGAFKKTGSSNYRKVRVKIPKKMRTYQKMFRKKGLSSKARIDR